MMRRHFLCFSFCVVALLVNCALAHENDTSTDMSPTTAASDVGESAGTTQSTTTAAAVSDSRLNILHMSFSVVHANPYAP